MTCAGVQWPCRVAPLGGCKSPGGDSNVKGAGMVVVSLRVVNFGF